MRTALPESAVSAKGLWEKTPAFVKACFFSR